MSTTLTLLLLAGLLAGAQQPLQRSLEIWSEHPIAIEIEWLTIDETGTQTVTARRKRAVGPPIPLEFTHGSDRYVRFSYQGASPRTYSTAELIAAKKLHVPDVLPGGELLMFVPPMTVRPTGLLIEGPRVKTVALDSAVHASLPGMPGGEYRIVPIYEGGIKGEPHRAVVTAAQTTIAVMAAEAVGAVRVHAADEVCAMALEMGISTLVAGPGPRRIVTSKEPRCEMIFGGLKPGRFEVFYRGETSGGAGGQFEVEPQAVSAVHVAARRVRVDGRVTLNGKPVPNTSLSFFVSLGGSGVSMQAGTMTDANGFYSVSLQTAGKYSVQIGRPQAFEPKPRAAEFVEGRNVYDVAFTGGTIRLVVTGWDDRTPLQVRIQGKTGTMVTNFAGRGKTPPLFEGLPFGEYKVSAGTGAAFIRQASTNAKTVVLTPASPEATVTFDITKR